MVEQQTFAHFWVAYPRPLGKMQAEKMFARIPPLAVPEVMAGLELWKAYWQAVGTELQYIPYASTWLNQRRWEEIPEMPNAKLSKSQQRSQRNAAVLAGMVRDFREGHGPADRNLPRGNIATGNRQLSPSTERPVTQGIEAGVRPRTEGSS